MANIICIVCPKGCRLTVDENTLAVTGNGCPRGAEYGKNEPPSGTRFRPASGTFRQEMGYTPIQ